MSDLDWRDAMTQAARRTEPTRAQVDRLRERLAPQVRSTKDLLDQLPEAQPIQLQRVRAKVLAGQRRPRHRPLAIPGLALAAVSLVAVGAWLAAADPVEPAVVPALTVVSLEGSRVLTDGLAVVTEGSGEARGSGKTWDLDLDRGRVHLDIAPEQGFDVDVSTGDAVVHVVGTVFSVERDALGTHVEVQRGAVQVDCLRGADLLIEGSGRHNCLPATAAGLLGRARALMDRGDADAAALESLMAGLADEPEVAVRGELLAASVEVQLRLGDTDRALEGALAYLDTGETAREAALRQLAVDLLSRSGACDRAAELVDEGTRVPPCGH